MRSTLLTLTLKGLPGADEMVRPLADGQSPPDPSASMAPSSLSSDVANECALDVVLVRLVAHPEEVEVVRLFERFDREPGLICR
jgi:hypothetical protein